MFKLLCTFLVATSVTACAGTIRPSYRYEGITSVGDQIYIIGHTLYGAEVADAWILQCQTAVDRLECSEIPWSGWTPYRPNIVSPAFSEPYLADETPQEQIPLDPVEQASACEAGNMAACHRLGLRFLLGDGVALNATMACELFGTACSQGYGAACRSADEQCAD